MNDGKNEGGISLLEMVVVLAVLVPMVLAVGNTNTAVMSTVDANNRQADAVSAARRATRVFADFARPAKMSTIQVQAVPSDVAAGLATSVGEWIPPTDGVWRPGIEFLSAAGLLSMNAALNTSPRRMTFVLDPGETVNGVDDDDDGLIDEGSVELLHESAVVAIVRDVEECRFSLQDRLLRIRIRAARRDANQLVHRTVIEKRLFLRNN